MWRNGSAYACIPVHDVDGVLGVEIVYRSFTIDLEGVCE